ncbi:MAG: histidinol-phosphate transaminase [Nocardioidaceae bacterium]
MTELPLRDELRGATPYGAPELPAAVRLNVNENPYGPSAEVAGEMADVVRALGGDLNRYPDREALALRGDLARYLGHGLSADRVWAGNGSNEVMSQILQAFGGPGRSVLSFVPTYSMYAEYARTTATRWIDVARREDFSVDADEAAAVVRRKRPDVVLLASPNNPTGTAAGLDVVEGICAASPGVVVVDEAYAEFRRAGVPSALTLLDRFPRLVVTRTMSKAFGLAGVRLGYLAASAELVDALRLVRLPYHLSTVTQALARVALGHADETLATVDLLRTERDRAVSWLRAEGFQVADSDANFVLFGTFPDAHAVWAGLLDQGVLVRETGPKGWLRVSVGTPDEMAAFRSALTAVTGVRREAS